MRQELIHSQILLYAYMQFISTVYKVRKFLVMFYVLRLYASFEFYSDLTMVFRSCDYLRFASFTAFRKWITYLINFSLSKNENDLQFSINLRLITFDKHQMIIIIKTLIKFCILNCRRFSICIWWKYLIVHLSRSCPKIGQLSLGS